ncbi:aquaporin family protein [Bacillus sp. DNRA2]|uniref:MIP/aquaporin family protein n=1 Tax=Bacillus sp. DNRA2 TaxID=2723053 RepID=UPI00145EB5C9|nr:MIP/aquaporin family protein [Bacillus sp. DNRA2]NMD69260.1 aquaporin family protein [Bacillus sp. DNRA2]
MEKTNLLKRSIAEGIGTALLILIGAGTAAYNGIITAHGSAATLADAGIVAFAHAITIMGMIYTIGKFTGAHINPAVTIGLASIGKFPWKEVPAYLIAQFAGSIAGAYGIVVILGLDGVILGNLGAPGLGMTTGYLQGIAVEAIATFILMFVIMGTAVDQRAYKGLEGIAIGLMAGGIIMLAGGATGAAFNPARAFGPYLVNSVLDGNINWSQLAIYFIGPIIGSIVAAFTYRMIDSSREYPVSTKTSFTESVK